MNDLPDPIGLLLWSEDPSAQTATLGRPRAALWPRTDPHPVEQPDAVIKPRPIRIRAQQQPHTIRLAPTALT
ncbi:hypothetical protein QIS99_25540 [Streptomyces sp. B-S-A8]|uniref:Uncharacterized protein n=1 Tax=Streptomyces solicavernae TaxID=3043614 RepID=A0ABT6RZD5_9ACTN|nr:hypothetical protein [Streptomyces sp. B-S-A8]MDI3389529.1 hypothetical protein [Streptomyces sp. B-S-A8]